MIQFTVYGEPVAQARARATIIHGHIRMYDPKKSSSYKDYIKFVASEYAPSELIKGPLQMSVDIYRPIPKSFSKKKSALAESGTLRPITKPDVDNYIKAIKDALKNIIWKDDSQVVSLVVNKFYSEQPRIEVIINEMEVA